VLSEDLRDELAAIAPEADCDRLAELSGLFHVAGSVHLRGRGEIALHLDLASSGVARRAFALLRAFDVESEIRTYQQPAFDRATRYQLHVAGTAHAYETLHRAGVLDAQHRPLQRPPARVVARDPRSAAAHARTVSPGLDVSSSTVRAQAASALIAASRHARPRTWWTRTEPWTGSIRRCCTAGP